MVDESKMYGAQGGKARAAALSSEQKTAIARKAALARWGDDLPVEALTGIIRLGDISLPCAVLSNGDRVLTQSDFMRGMEMYYSGWVAKNRSAEDAAAEVPQFLSFKALKPFVDKHLGHLQSIIVKYRTKTGHVAHGIRAEIIPRICEIWLDADEAGVLPPRQKRIAAKAKLVMRGLAHVGIAALVDEATGFRAAQAADTMAEILRAFVQRELRPWVRTFPVEYYEELCRLRELPFPPTNMKLPGYIGHITNNVVYDRLAPGVKAGLKQLTPKDARGRHKQKLFQRLTEEIGHPKLREHLAAVVSLMKVSPDYDTFLMFLDKALPRWDDTLPLPLPPTMPALGGAVAASASEPLALPPATQPA